MIKLFEYNEVEFNSNGIKILSPTSVKIKRSLFDYEFQLEMCHPLNDKGLEIKEDRIIQYTDEKMGTQYFRIENIRKSLHQVEVTANSIFFDLNKNFIEDVNVVNKSFSVAVIPHTFENTNLKYKKNGDIVNLETDILARYVEKMILSDNKDDKLKSMILNFKR